MNILPYCSCLILCIWCRNITSLKECANHIDTCSKDDSNLYHHFFLSDEEVGGAKGMNLFVHMEYFKKLNVGFALDEGMIYMCVNLPVFVVYMCVCVYVCLLVKSL